MAIGPLALFLSALAIARRDSWLTAPDLTYLFALGVMVVGRWVEFWAGDARTADWEPATAGHVRRYSAWALVLGLGVWAGVNLWANHLAAP
jgi:hypothetical protein